MERDRANSQPTETDTPPHYLDSAVALLELSGHPHILGREAFATLQDASCAEALALGARSSRGIRLITADGWSDTEALTALRAATADDLMILGRHRDETWEILARPRPELEHRCTLTAIRKLIATARTLDQYRREEKQRAALWPTEALEADSDSLWVSEQSMELVRVARQLASSPLPILLTGETGTGKEMLARAHSSRLESRRQAVRSGQLHGCAARHARKPAVRPSPRRLHRRRNHLQRRHPRRRRRHALPRRDRRHEARAAAQAPAFHRRTTKSTRSASRGPSRSTSASLPPPTSTSTRW